MLACMDDAEINTSRKPNAWSKQTKIDEMTQSMEGRILLLQTQLPQHRSKHQEAMAQQQKQQCKQLVAVEQQKGATCCHRNFSCTGMQKVKHRMGETKNESWFFMKLAFSEEQ